MMASEIKKPKRGKMTGRYRINDQGALYCWNEADGGFIPIECSYRHTICGVKCKKYFHVSADGGTATISCDMPETVIELEE